ncbi:MAG: energy transducer TonB [Desulfobacterales bacterium]|nr:MAG: energy transducer TonB [Desulfobacterales bacterium]
MKRIFIAALLALGVHGLLLGVEFTWLRQPFLEKPGHRDIFLTLALRQPQVPIKKVVEKLSIIPEKRPIDQPVLPKKKIIPPVKKPKPQISQKSFVQPVEKPLSDAAAQIASEPSDSVEPIKMEPVPQAATQGSIRESTIQTMVEARPLYRVNPRPRYPAMARKRGYTGHVVLEVLVGQDGSVTDLRLFSSSGHPILDNAAIASVRTWIFEPGMRGEKKVEMWVRVPIRFELK